MNYAVLIALLMLLTFSLPFLAGLAENAGVPRGLSMLTTLAGALLALGGVFWRVRSQWRRSTEERVATGLEQRARAPHDPQAFYVQGDHLGDLLLTLGRRQEALREFEAYLALTGTTGEDVSVALQAVERLKKELASGATP